MPENIPISVQDTGKEFKIEAKYSLADLGIENEELQKRVNQKVEALMSNRINDILANPPKKWLGLKIDRDAIKAKLEEHAADMDALVKSHKEDISKLANSRDLNLDVYNLGETLEEEIKKVVNEKIGATLASAAARENLPAVSEKTEDIIGDVRTRKQMLDQIGK